MNFALAELLAHDWLIRGSDFHGLVLPVLQRAAALSAPDIQAAERAYAGRETGPIMAADVAVIRISGPIIYKSSWLSYYCGFAAIDDLQAQFRTALADPAAKTIVFQVNSPGGTVEMTSEFADEIYAARGTKPMIAVADTLMASAAYWIGVQADTIYATRSSVLGAVGVYCERLDLSAMLEKAGIHVEVIAHGANKGTMGNPSQRMTDEERAKIQAHVDETGDWFDVAVARARGVTKKVVLDTFGQGDIFRGEQAIAIGMADKKGTFGQVISRLTKGRVTATAARAAATPAPALAARADIEDDGCDTCSPDCPCDEETCAEDCPTCDESCACRAAAKAKAATTPAPAAADASAADLAAEHEAIAAAIGD